MDLTTIRQEFRSLMQPIGIVAFGPDGTTSNVTVEQDLGHDVDDLVISRLRAKFPETAVSSGTEVADS